MIRRRLKIALVFALAAGALPLSAVPSYAHGTCTYQAFQPWDSSGILSNSVSGKGTITCGYSHVTTHIKVTLQWRRDTTYSWQTVATATTDASNTNTASAIPKRGCYTGVQPSQWRSVIVEAYTVSATGNVAHKVSNIASTPYWIYCAA
jgi:hypothetical protein